MKPLFLIFCIFLTSCSTTSQKSSELNSVSSSKLSMFYNPEDLFKKEFIENTGRLIWIKDSLAWQATDILVDAVDISQIKNGRGWIVHLDKPKTPTVSFYQDLEGKLHVIADVVFDQNFQNPTLQLTPDRNISLQEQSMVTALTTVRASIKEACSPTVNSVVLPMENGWQVYILTSTKEPGVIPVGGHKQYITSADGKVILSDEAYSKSCIKLKAPADSKGVMLTHIVSDFPAPTHVFHNLQTGLTFYVKTERGIWKIHEGIISLLEES